ncbi:MAG: hypothetical protein KF910_03700 [Brevundimonas sp.]|uniref:hypothetical protein n=1 Tax=Brevundimonas sp. TaxID=1871086 RepID=UPI0025C3A527|nr:hypothetical protein [Brevundimonas sp.]MBX3476684.1 hypothetical protein [Brevundimonas sp.]
MTDKFTVGDLRRHLSGYADDIELEFAGGVTFYRLKGWGDDGVVLEFNEMQADLSPETRKSIKVAFCHSEPFEGLASVAYVPRI